jgi:hypothetical protein
LAQIFGSDIYFDLQEATGFDSLPPESDIWTNAGFGQSNFTALSGAKVACADQGGTGSILFPMPTLTPDLYVVSIVASAQAQALKTRNPNEVGIDTVKQTLASPSFQSSAKASIQSFISTPAATSTVSDAKIITNILANVISPGLSPSASQQVKELSSLLTAPQVLAVASSVSIPLGPMPAPELDLPPYIRSILSALTEAGGAVEEALSAAAEALVDATNEAMVNSGGNLEEMPLEILVSMTGWVGRSLIVDGPSTVFDPVALPDPSDAGIPAGTSNPDGGP